MRKEENNNRALIKPPFSAQLLLLTTLFMYRDKNEIMGDLEEIFRYRMTVDGRKQANRWYRKQVVSLIPTVIYANIKQTSMIFMKPVNRIAILAGKIFHVLIRKTIWERLTSIPKLFNYRIATVQIAAIDKEKQQLIILKTMVTNHGHTLPQGLCKKLFFPFVFIPKDTIYIKSRADAARELHEEAVREKIDKKRLKLLTVYDESKYRQFRCHLYILETTTNEFTLRQETAEGKVSWMQVAEGLDKLGNPQLAGFIRSWLNNTLVPLNKTCEAQNLQLNNVPFDKLSYCKVTS